MNTTISHYTAARGTLILTQRLQVLGITKKNVGEDNASKYSYLLYDIIFFKDEM